MNRCKTIHELCLLCCALTCPLILGCDVPSLQIGQLDSESGEDTSTSEDTSDETTGSQESLPASCQKGVDNLHTLYGGEFELRCSIVLRSDYQTGEIIGWQNPCNSDLDLSVEEARALTHWGGENISNDERNFVFYSDTPDARGLAFVGANSGLGFDASIETEGVGVVTKPLESDLFDPSWMGSGCSDVDPGFSIELWPYDLSGAEAVFSSSPAMDRALDANWDTGLFYTIEGYEAVTMLTYPGALEPFDPAAAEIVTIFDRGERP